MSASLHLLLYVGRTVNNIRYLHPSLMLSYVLLPFGSLEACHCTEVR